MRLLFPSKVERLTCLAVKRNHQTSCTFPIRSESDRSEWHMTFVNCGPRRISADLGGSRTDLGRISGLLIGIRAIPCADLGGSRTDLGPP